MLLEHYEHGDILKFQLLTFAQTCKQIVVIKSVHKLSTTRVRALKQAVNN